MPTIEQSSFAGGIVAARLKRRADQPRRLYGVEELRNLLVRSDGTLANVPGTRFLSAVKNSSHRVRLLSFIFNDEQSYALELGNGYARFYVDSAMLVTSGVAAWSGATAYAVGDLAKSGGTNYYCTVAHTNKTPASNPAHWYAQIGNIYEIPTPWALADLADLRTEQVADIVWIVHRGHPVMQLRRLGHTHWTLLPASFQPELSGPTGIAAVKDGGSGVHTYRYKVTALQRETMEESLVGRRSASVGTVSIDAGGPGGALGLVAPPGTFAVGEDVFITALTPTLSNPAISAHFSAVLLGKPLRVASITMPDLSERAWLLGTEDVPFEFADATVSRTFAEITSAVFPRPASFGVSKVAHTVSWTAVPDASEYWVYKEKNGVYGFIGIASGTSFEDEGQEPNVQETPPIYTVPFSGPGRYPGVVAVHQQRLVLASSDEEPQAVWLSRTGNFKNFTIRSPLLPDDSVTFTVAGSTVNEIRGLLVAGQMLVLTSGAIWKVTGDSSGSIRPDAINLEPQSFDGIANVAPLAVGGATLYVKALGGRPHDMRYEFGSDSYGGRDLGAFAPHLFGGRNIESWARMIAPSSVVLAQRSDGVLLGLTYEAAEEIAAWWRRDFFREAPDGSTIVDACESVTVIPENGRSTAYVVVRRTINGATKRYVEFVEDRYADHDDFDPRTQGFFVDSGLTYDGTNATATTLTLSGGPPWDPPGTLALAASAPLFALGDVGNGFRLSLLAADGSVTAEVEVDVTAFTDNQNVTVVPRSTVPVALRGVATVQWVKMVDELSGLSHLEGEQVVACADGVALGPFVVASGAITLAAPYGVIHVGLPICSEIGTLPMASHENASLAVVRKNPRSIVLHADRLREVLVGPDREHLTEWTGPEYGFQTPHETYSGEVVVGMMGEWDREGRVVVSHRKPLPLAITGYTLLFDVEEPQ